MHRYLPTYIHTLHTSDMKIRTLTRSRTPKVEPWTDGAPRTLANLELRV